METAGLQLDTSSNAALAASLAAVVAAAPTMASLVRALATRAMSEAQYFSTGTLHGIHNLLMPILVCAGLRTRDMSQEQCLVTSTNDRSCSKLDAPPLHKFYQHIACLTWIMYSALHTLTSPAPSNSSSCEWFVHANSTGEATRFGGGGASHFGLALQHCMHFTRSGFTFLWYIHLCCVPLRRRDALWWRRRQPLRPGAAALHALHQPHPPLCRPAGAPAAAGCGGRWQSR